MGPPSPLTTSKKNLQLASCQWGPATAHGVGTLTEMCVMKSVEITNFKEKTHRTFDPPFY